LPESPPSLPGTLSRPDAQRIIDALNLRLFEVEEGQGINAGKVTDDKLAKPTIVGRIAAAGTVLTGTGFTAEKTATGTYKITLTTELATTGVLVATPFEALRTASCNSESTKVFEVLIFNTATNLAENIGFSFHIKAA